MSDRKPLAIANAMPILTPDDIMVGQSPKGTVVIYDDDQIYIGGVLAAAGHKVIFATPANMASPYTELTLEQKRIQKSLIERQVNILTGQELAGISDTGCKLSCVYSGQLQEIECSSVLLATNASATTHSIIR